MSFDRFLDDFMRGRKAPAENGALTKEQKAEVRGATQNLPAWLIYESNQLALGRKIDKLFKISYRRPETVGFTPFVPIAAISKEYGKIVFNRKKKFQYDQDSSEEAACALIAILRHEQFHAFQITYLDMLRRVLMRENALDWLVQLLSGRHDQETELRLKKHFAQGMASSAGADHVLYEIAPSRRGLSVLTQMNGEDPLADVGITPPARIAVARKFWKDMQASSIHHDALAFSDQIDKTLGRAATAFVLLASTSAVFSREGLVQFMHRARDRVGKNIWYRLGTDLKKGGEHGEKALSYLRDLQSEMLRELDYKKHLLDLIGGESLLPSGKRRARELKHLIEYWKPYEAEKVVETHPRAAFAHTVFFNADAEDKDLHRLILVDKMDDDAGDELVKTFCMAPDLSIANMLFARYKHDKKLPKDDRDFILCPMRFSPDFDCNQGTPLCEHERGWADAVRQNYK